MKEIFKDITGYEGIYQVSNLGRVRSLDRFDSRGKKWLGILLKPCKDGRGYFSVDLSRFNKVKKFRVHVLVAQAFLNHIPNGYEGLIVDHIDNNKLNNRVDNLQLTTARHNTSKDRKGSSEYTGVTWHKRDKKWYANIRINGKQKYLGCFNCEYSAHLAYQKELKNIEMNINYFEKLKLQAEQFNEMTRKRTTRTKFLYQIGFSYDEVNDMGYGLKKKL